MMALLADALLPNLVQTTEGTPALVHTGPFGNIAHGTSSILSQKMGVRLADYVVNECGFAADLGAEKYFDIVMRTLGHSACGRGSGHDRAESARAGRGTPRARLRQIWITTYRRCVRFGVPIVVAINRFPNDTAEELELIAAECDRQEVPWARVEAFAKGGAGLSTSPRRWST